ncbi:hypothetical protein B0T18DRAFT_397946 [Schizothecium vesticola]|uniref:WW domain-containing protein n=1 Tax=Schizothecium vesticola TaxID=314040 RepID=A0AA40F9S0_9PEZI|nr:hypothetical protein B0T18DRAFT_397946 [Schizothecium vesticola]
MTRLTKLPKGWKSATSAAASPGRIYYYTKQGDVSWEPPTTAAPEVSKRTRIKQAFRSRGKRPASPPPDPSPRTSSYVDNAGTYINSSVGSGGAQQYTSPHSCICSSCTFNYNLPPSNYESTYPPYNGYGRALGAASPPSAIYLSTTSNPRGASRTRLGPWLLGALIATCVVSLLAAYTLYCRPPTISSTSQASFGTKPSAPKSTLDPVALVLSPLAPIFRGALHVSASGWRVVSWSIRTPYNLVAQAAIAAKRFLDWAIQLPFRAVVALFTLVSQAVTISTYLLQRAAQLLYQTLTAVLQLVFRTLTALAYLPYRTVQLPYHIAIAGFTLVRSFVAPAPRVLPRTPTMQYPMKSGVGTSIHQEAVPDWGFRQAVGVIAVIFIILITLVVCVGVIAEKMEEAAAARRYEADLLHDGVCVLAGSIEVAAVTVARSIALHGRLTSGAVRQLAQVVGAMQAIGERPPSGARPPQRLLTDGGGGGGSNKLGIAAGVLGIAGGSLALAGSCNTRGPHDLWIC